ncbi:hypothetical protein [Paractinoplanes ovalisporus]|nr:hypothetical protein [Actinoplanes ovalisporus]
MSGVAALLAGVLGLAPVVATEGTSVIVEPDAPDVVTLAQVDND